MSIMFSILFKVLPDVEITWRNVGMGAVITSLLFSLGKMLIGMYIAHSNLQSLYGAAATFADNPGLGLLLVTSLPFRCRILPGVVRSIRIRNHSK